MTYRNFAEQVLFSTSLEEKLAGPTGKLVDEEQGLAILSPDQPGRPDYLRTSAVGEGAARPNAHLLEDAEDQHFLLHQFANHELLAAELMALALLKFPNAPAAFRQGLVRTLQEEQEHTRLYIARLAEIGISFGSRPVNGFFWRCVADMETPLDYVSRLSLTFEQANLDFSQYFAGRFAQVGDAASAKILEQIYQDELFHVSYGLHWFRRWQGKDVDEWQAYCQQLTFPLTPVRAKGTVGFNAAGRRQAGFTEHYIQQLEICQFSRGRSPWVRYFNPGAEECAARNDPQAATRDPILQALSTDLDTLSLFLAAEDDLALLRNPVRTEFLLELKAARIPLPEISLLGKDEQLAADSPLQTRKLGRLRPWGWSPDSESVLGCLREQASAEPAGAVWDESVRRLYAKAESLNLLASLPWSEAFGPPEIIGKACGNLEQAQAAIAQVWAAGSHAVVKASFSLAGRGMAIFPMQSKLQGLETLTGSPGGCVVEPQLARLADFSAHYEVEEPHGPIRLKGLVHLDCLPSGKFIGCRAGPQFSRLLPSRVARFCHEQGNSWLKQLYNEILPAALSAWIGESGFRGMLGIDAFFYETATGQVALKPVVEVNPRCTMGRVTMELRRFIAPQSQVEFTIQSARKLKKTKETLLDWAAREREANPIQLTAQHKIASGVFFLNDVTTAREFLAVARVRK